MTFLEMAIKVLKEEKRPLTPTEIWEISTEKGYINDLNTKGKTPWQSLSAQLYVDVKDNPESLFKTIGTRPKKFILNSFKESTIEESEINKITTIDAEIKDKSKLSKIKERDLHPLLSYYAYTYLNAYTKTIYHEKSDKKKYSQWLHPDIVGVTFPIGQMDEDVVDFSVSIGSSVVKLYSFELKKELNFSNLRESFFQTVSNSSWSNEGYLVAASIDENDEFRTELKRLSSSFGIGVIRIDIEDPDSSKIIYPARINNNLDWDTINKLTEGNPDFKNFLRRINKDLSIKEIRKEDYDKILKLEELIVN